MSGCKRSGSDRLLKELVDKGINVILPPRAGLKPGDLIVADKHGAARVADWRVVLGVDPGREGQAEPSFQAQSFTVSDAQKLGAGGSIVGRALAFFGLGDGSFQGALGKTGASELNIALTAPAVSALVNLDEVLEALRTARAMPRPGYQDRRLLVVTKVWRARGLSLELLSEDGGHVEATADVTAELQAKTKLEVADRRDGRITFLAGKALVFGVTLREIEATLDGVRDIAPDDHFTFRSGDSQETYSTVSDELFVDLGELDAVDG